MKTNKSYTCLISGNNCKVNYLQQQLEIIEDLSWYIYRLNADLNGSRNIELFYRQLNGLPVTLALART